MSNNTNRFSQFAAWGLITLSFQSVLLSSTARAEFGSLACYNISDRWTQAVNQFLGQIESRVNDQVDQYVSLLNFDLGNTDFGVQGAADIGQLKTPTFDCANPKAVLKSGIADVGIAPRYLISARIFGLPISVLDARMEGGQGPRTNVTRPADAKDKLKLSVKVIGIDVLNRTRRGPEVEVSANQGQANPGDMPAKETMGTGGKLFDITRSLSDSLGGQAPRIDVIAPFLYVQFDAGFFLQSDLIFTYGVESALFNFNKSASFGQLKSSLSKNPANQAQDYCEAEAGTTGTCAPRSGLLTRKAQDFYQALKNSTDLDDRVLQLRQTVRDINVERLTQDARNTKSELAADWSRLTDGSMTTNDRKTLLESYELDKVIRPWQGTGTKIQGLFDQAQGAQTSFSHSLNQIQALSSAFENGFPEVKADAGLALSGKAGAWANAMLVVDAVVAKGWAGVEGKFTLIDIRGGLDAALSSKSQYLDLTVSLQQIRMMGELDLVYGVKIGIDPVSTTSSGSKVLVSWPGSFSKKQWLAGRVDFKPAGKAPLFWCWDIFGAGSVDAERCADGNLAKSQYATALAADNELNYNMANDPNMDDSAQCFISDTSGRVIATAGGAGSACANALPANSSAELALPGQALPALALRYKSNPEIFATNLRDDANRPAKTLAFVSAAGDAKGSQTYYAAKAIAPPFVGQGDVYRVDTFSLLSQAANQGASALEKKIYSVPYQAVFVDRPGQPTVRAGHEDADLLIQMDWAKTNWPDYSQAKLFIGDLPSLPNDLLVAMGKSFRLGRCSVSEQANDLLLDVAGRPYPATGDASGSALANASLLGSECSTGASVDANHIADPKQAFAACELRVALQAGECFPAARAVTLVNLANLSDADALKYFLGVNAPKWISGEVVVSNRMRDLSVEPTVHIAEDRNPSTGIETLLNTYFSGTGFGRQPYSQADANRCNIPNLDQGGADQDHWFERIYHSNCLTCVATQELKIHSRPSAACYAVKSNLASSTPYAVGSSACASNAFRSNYSYSPAADSKANSILCDPTNPSHRDTFAQTNLPNLKSSAAYSPSSAMGLELTAAVKRCIAGDTEACVYTPGNPLAPEDGGNIGNPLGLASCAMRVTAGANNFEISANAQSNSLDACLQQNAGPVFSDAQSFCQSQVVKPQLAALANSALSASAGNGTVSMSLTARRLSTPEESRYVGSCNVVMSNSQITQIYGVTAQPLNTALATRFTYGCDLRVRKDSNAAHHYFVTQAAADDLTDPLASSANCWRALGFPGTADDSVKANEVCSTLGPDTLIGLFQNEADLVNGNETAVKSVSAELYSERSAQLDRSQICTVSKTVKQWRDLINNGKCSLQLMPLVFNGTLPQTLRIPSSGGLNSCISSAQRYSADGCKTLCALPQYLPFSTNGAQVSVIYGVDPLSTPAAWNCSCSFDPLGDEPGQIANNCTLKGVLKLPSGASESQTFVSAPLKTNEAVPQDSNACVAAWAKTTFDANYKITQSYCAALAASVENRLAINGSTSGQIIDQSGRKVWQSGQSPLSGVITSRLSTAFAGGGDQALGACDFQFATDTPASVALKSWHIEVARPYQSQLNLAAIARDYRTNFMQEKRTSHTQTLLPDGRVLITGGYNGNALASAELYDPMTRKFSRTGSMLFPRSSHTATLLPSGKVLVVGGTDYSITAEIYDPTTEKFTLSQAGFSYRTQHSATLLANGKVLIAGGHRDLIGNTAVEIYDPNNDSNTQVGSLVNARWDHTATLLNDSRVLLAGGRARSNTIVNAEVFNPTDNSLTAVGPLNVARQGHRAVKLGNGTVLITGGNPWNGALASTEIFDPASNSFVLGGSLNVARSNHASILLSNGNVAVFGGSGAGDVLPSISSIEIYDVGSGSFTRLAISLSELRSGAMSTLLPDNTVLITGGSANITQSGTSEIFNSATNTLSAVAITHPVKAGDVSADLGNGKILTLGGVVFNTSQKSAEIFDSASGVFTATGSLNLARNSHTAVTLNDGRVLAVGGYTATGQTTNTAEIYNPSSQKFSFTGALQSARANHTANLLSNGKVLVVGGFDNQYLASADLYDPSTGVFTATGSLARGRYNHQAVNLRDGRVLIVGGFQSGGDPTVVEAYDPSSGQFSSLGRLTQVRANASATLLPSGKVLIVGGNGNSGYLASAELFDPVSGTSRLVGSMSSARALHSATILNNGTVAIVGGQANTYVTTVEIFDPVSETFSLGVTPYDTHILHTANLLPSGELLISNGYGSGTGFWEILPADGKTVSPIPNYSEWLVIGHENDLVTLAPGSVVRYGANSSYVLKTVGGQFNGTNSYFGSDPAPGAYKSIELNVPANWTTIGHEGDILAVPPNTLLRFGANGSYISKTLSGTIQLNIELFGGDPAYGVYKSIDKYGLGSSWVRIGSEYDLLQVQTPSVVRFGANGSYIYKVVTGSFRAETKFFGADPANGVRKDVELLQ